MTDENVAVLETPKRRFAVRLPSRSTLAKAGALTGTFALGVVVGAKKVRDACACDTDTDETAAQSTD